jgi:YggT family protein
MNAFLTDVGGLIIQVAFGLFLFAVLLRLLLQILRGDFYNPLSQALVMFTNPVVRPLRRFIPGLLGIDLASVVALYGLKCLELFLLDLIGVHQRQPLPLPIPLWAVIELLNLTLYLFIIALIVRALLSWVVPPGAGHNPALSVLSSLTEPLLRPVRRRLPPMGGFDLSPVAVILFLIILQYALAHLVRNL